MKKNIVFVGNTAWSMYNFRRVIFQRLINQGYCVTVISPPKKEFQDRLREIGCKCISVDLDAKGINPIKDIKLIFDLRKIFKSISPDFLFFYTIKPNIYGSIAARTLNLNHIAITTGLGFIFLKKGLVSLIAKNLYKISFKKAHQVWFLNEDDKIAFLDNKLVKENKTYILKGEGIDLSFFKPVDKTESTSFLLMARMLWDKGVSEFVEAARLLKKQHPNVTFKLLGFVGVNNPSAIPKSQIDEWVSEGVVEYLGTTNDVRPYIADSSCVVLPSYREGVPVSLLEGAAMGKPLVATNSVGCKETIEDGKNGFLCKVKDVDSLKIAMEKIILMSPEERYQMGLEGRRKMENEFDVELIASHYIQILNRVFDPLRINSWKEGNQLSLEDEKYVDQAV